MDIDFNNTHWDRLKGFVTELRVDARWVLRDNTTDKPLGSLRIVSHPDCPPGQLRAFFSYVTSIRPKSKIEKLQATEDYQIEESELEVFSIDSSIKTDSIKYEAPFKELEKLFNVDIFES